MQTFTFYASDDKLQNRGNEASKKFGCAAINEAACDLAREVADEGDALVAGGVCQTPTYLSGKGKEACQAEFQKQVDVFIKKDVDFIIAEYYEHVEEAVWAVELLKKTGKPIAASLCIGPEGDMHGVSAGDCAVRLAEAGADCIGVNCHYGPIKSLETMRLMKAGLDAAGYKKHLMIQPLGYHTPDCGKQGFIDLPEFPFGLEPRICTRWDMHKYAREAYDMGIRFIGGCCGFEPYHIRALSEELAKERGKFPKGSEKHGLWGDGLRQHTKPWVRSRARRDYWEKLNPSSGRPFSASCSKPDNWGITAGHDYLKQHAEDTSDKELKEIMEVAQSR
ncbi:betaine--homocysteine S-methyltransferase 1 isoform X2 [Nematostella vectensis]|nr:betaine--homocysteine S-methyltransferase 1 isoform X2 [Nematostella vectensis]